MTNNITLLHYNNYYNRIIKKLDTVAEYHAADSEIVGGVVIPHYLDISSINFVPGDGIDTSLVLGTVSLNMDYDYLIVTHTDSTTTPATEVIDSRWFIVEENRTRDGQYEVTLKRDVIADNYNTVLDCTAYIEKGTLQAGSPLLFNKEGLEVNQIKKSEKLLKDNTEVPWIVAYIAKNAKVNDRITINYDPAEKDYIELSAQTIQDWSYYQYSSAKFYGPLTVSRYRINWQAGTGDNWHYGHFMTIFDNSGNVSYDRIQNDDWSYVLRANDTSSSAMQNVSAGLSTAWNNIGPEVFNQAAQEHFNAHTTAEVDAFMRYNGKIVKTQDGKYYFIRVFGASGLSLNDSTVSNFNSSSPLFTRIKQAIVNSGRFNSSYNTPNTASFFFTASAPAYSMSYEEIEGKTVKAKISENRRKTTDALYDIVCLPYGDFRVYDYDDAALLFETNKDVSMAAINALATELGGGSETSGVYDIQLLPYCPLQSAIDIASHKFYIDPAEEGTSFDYIIDESTQTPSNVGIILYVPESSFTFNINDPINIQKFTRIASIDDITTTSLAINTTYIFKTLDLENPPAEDDPILNGAGIGTDVRITRRSLPARSIPVDDIKVSKINKVTGKIIEELDCCSINFDYYPDNENNELHLWKAPSFVGPSGLIETITNSDYANTNYYLAFEVKPSSTMVRVSQSGTEVLTEICGIPVFDNTVSDQYAIKYDNECKMYRMVSPNYQGDFEFSVAKNLGVESFNIDCTYKPYQPYIHVNPLFNGLYGQDFNDSRGLICNGDFSFGMVSNAFANYELQNKNYQAIFNRQIQNMDVEHSIALKEARWGVAGGTVQAASSGAMAGAMAGGGGWGAAIGGIVGGASSLMGGIADVGNLRNRQAEQRSFASDMYVYSLQNVKALPNSLTKCTALTYNNKLFPFIEIYECTEEEQIAFFKKLQFDGMTVDVIGRLGDYTGGLVRGEVIRFSPSDIEPLKADAHMANAIYAEIKKGVYI